MVAGKQVDTVRQAVFGCVGEAVWGFSRDYAGVQQMASTTVEGYFPETHDDFDAWQCGDLCSEVLATVTNLLRERFVSGRGAADDGADPCMAKLEAIVASDGSGLAGEAEVVQDRVHKVTGAVSSKRASGAISAVCAGSESNDEYTGAWISKAGDGARPVGLILIGTAASVSDALAVGSEAGAEFAVDDVVLNLLKQ